MTAIYIPPGVGYNLTPQESNHRKDSSGIQERITEPSKQEISFSRFLTTLVLAVLITIPSARAFLNYERNERFEELRRLGWHPGQFPDRGAAIITLPYLLPQKAVLQFKGKV